MIKEPARKVRVTRDDWMQAALQKLSVSGISSVTIQSLAGHLGVTRGSFYHHFQDRAELTRAMLEFWAEEWTYSILSDVEALSMKGSDGLRAVGQLVQHRHAADKDVAVRAWALHDPEARKLVKEVDDARLNFIRGRMAEIGFEGLDLENRARLLLYYMMTEPAFFSPPDEETTRALMQIRLDLLTRVY